MEVWGESMCRKRAFFRAILGVSALALLGGACSSSSGGGGGDNDPGDPNNPPGDPNGGDLDLTPAPYNNLTWEFDTVHVQAGSPAGIQGKLLQGDDGTLYYAFFKRVGLDENCDIAVFGGGTALGIDYRVLVGILPPGGGWTVETIPLGNAPGATHDSATALFGIDGVLDNSGNPTFAFAAGASGLFTCGSSDLVVATRTGTDTWAFNTQVPTNSGSCCSDCPPLGACGNGTDVGAWAAIARDPNGNLAAAFADHHNFADEDGQTFQGLEFWHAQNNVFGIEPWSGVGAFSDLIYAGPTAVVASAPFNAQGLRVYRLTGSGNNVAAWEEQSIPGIANVGQRLSLAKDANGRLGMALFESSGEDLMYTESNDAGETWSTPLVVDEAFLNHGQTPSLVFDGANRPLISYRVCGTAPGSCDPNTDGLWLTWRELDGSWNKIMVHGVGGNFSGLYSSMVLDPNTGAPVIVFQDETQGAAMAARGILPTP